MSAKLVSYEASNGIATITLDDPPVNGYSFEMNSQVDTAILEARFDTDVHVIVLRGGGEKFFCAGANIDMLAAADPTFKYYFCLHANETLSRLEQTPKLTIAALNGRYAIAGLVADQFCGPPERASFWGARDAATRRISPVSIPVLPLIF